VRWTARVAIAMIALCARTAAADPLDRIPELPPAPKPPPSDRVEGLIPTDVTDAPDKEATEYAGAPVLGGNTDFGFQIGAAATVTRVAPGYWPYRWRMDGLLSASIKGGARGTEVAQQSHDLRIDVPRAVSGKIRMMPAIFFERTINTGYYGIGNAAPLVTDASGRVGNRYQYIHQEIRARVNMRTPIADGPFSVMYGLTLRHVEPGAYPGSRLDIDSRREGTNGEPYLRGLEPLGHALVAAGLVYDTRNSEIIPSKGAFDLVALRGGGAAPTSSGVRYGGLNVILRRYLQLKEPFVLAGRAFADLGFGDYAFYDLSQGGAFAAIDIPGGPQGIRGVPNGRYSGLVKLVGNVELRAMHTKLRLLGEDFTIGNNVFADFGRIFTSYSPDARDGRGLGLKYGVGAGVYVLWGSAAIFRLEVAYSPDATAANPGFPVGIYVADGQMF
jgi:hypothetical protein